MVLSIEVLTHLDKCLIAFDGTFPGEAAAGSEATHAAQLPLGARDDLGEGDALELSRRLCSLFVDDNIGGNHITVTRG